MGKYGKPVEINTNILAYNIGLIGESGIGKSTVIKILCEKVAGEDGYIALDIGKENGHDAISGIISEPVPTWKKFVDVIEDIVINKETDYKNLKVVVIDTIDQLFEITEPEVVRLHNVDNKEKKVTSIKAAFGGFQAGEDKAIELVLEKLWKLKSVGVAFIIIGHTKRKDVDDAVTGQTYSTLTTNMSNRYFNAIKNKLHVLGVACVDREIVQQKTGKKNIVTKQEEVKGKVLSERRKITFRDDNYTIDSKSRFANIVDSIPLDADELIKAIEDAIAIEKGIKTTTSKAKVTTKPPIKAADKKISPPLDDDDIPDEESTKVIEEAVVADEVIDEDIDDSVFEDDDENKEDADEMAKKIAMIEETRRLYKAASASIKKEIKDILQKEGTTKLEDTLPIEVVESMLAILK